MKNKLLTMLEMMPAVERDKLVSAIPEPARSILVADLHKRGVK